MVGVVGTDQNSQLLRKVTRSEKINQEYVTEFDGVCGTAIIEVDASGQNRIIVIPGANGELNLAIVGVPRELISHEEFKIKVGQSLAIIHTGDAVPYSSVILRSG